MFGMHAQCTYVGTLGRLQSIRDTYIMAGIYGCSIACNVGSIT